MHGRRAAIGQSGEAARPGARRERQDQAARAVLTVEGKLAVRRDLDGIGAQVNLAVVDVAFHAPELAHWISSLERRLELLFRATHWRKITSVSSRRDRVQQAITLVDLVPVGYRISKTGRVAHFIEGC